MDHLDCLFQEYGYDVKERTASYRVYLLNQGMYHGAEIQIMDDDIDATPILDRYSKLGYHAKQQRFKSIEQAESYLFKGFFNTQTTANDINRRYTEFAANQVKHYCNCGIKYQYISMPYSIYSEGAEDTVSGTSDIISAIKEAINRKGAHLVVVEAAAGFGKTCTAYEVYKSFLDNISSNLNKESKSSKNKLDSIETKISKLTTRKNNALNKFIDDCISKDDYDNLVESINSELNELKSEKLLLESTMSTNLNSNLSSGMCYFKSIASNINDLTPDVVNRLIDKIEVSEDGTPRIYYRFSESSICLSDFINQTS